MEVIFDKLFIESAAVGNGSVTEGLIKKCTTSYEDQRLLTVDSQGRNIVHIAFLHGHLDYLEVLMKEHGEFNLRPLLLAKDHNDGVFSISWC
jgi:hypothetical protein